MTHQLKLRKSYCDAVMSGEKNFEIRNNDRGFQKGDFIRFTAVENRAIAMPFFHPIQNNLYRITYVHSGLGMKEGYVALGITLHGLYIEED